MRLQTPMFLGVQALKMIYIYIYEIMKLLFPDPSSLLQECKNRIFKRQIHSWFHDMILRRTEIQVDQNTELDPWNGSRSETTTHSRIGSLRQNLTNDENWWSEQYKLQ